MRAIKNIIGAVFISIAAMAFWVFILPGYEMQSYLKSSVEVRTTALDSKTKLIEKIADLNREYQEKFNELKRLSLVVPSEKNIAEVITSIEDISSQNGINLSELTISEASNTDTTKSYGLLSLNVIFSGDYDAMLNFLDQLEKHIRLVDVSALTLGIDDNESTESRIVLTVDLEGSVYFLKPIVDQRATLPGQTNAGGVEQ